MVPVTANDRSCAYCGRRVDTERLGNLELVNLMREHNAKYTRHSQFCQVCKTRAKLKLRGRKIKEAKLQALKSSEKTASYSNVSGLETSSESRPSRNVARRTGGKPKRTEQNSSSSSISIPDVTPPSDNSNSKGPANRTRSRSKSQTFDDSGSEMDIPIVSPDSGSPTRRSERNVTNPPSFEVEVEIDDGLSQCNYSSEESMQSAPPVPNRSQRTDQPSRPPTPERMSSMSSEERSSALGKYKRPDGG